MTTKLTLTIEEKVIQRAKRYAHKKGRSLSDIVENYLMALTTSQEEPEHAPVSKKVRSLRGVFKAPNDFNYKDALSESLTKKYRDE